MDISQIIAIEGVINIIEGQILNSASLWFTIGLVLTWIGLFFLFIFIWAQIKGRRVEGRLVGAIKRISVKEKISNGNRYKKTEIWIWPVFEYKNSDGQLVQEIGNESVDLNNDIYKTGQKVNLLVLSYKNYDEVCDADKKSTLYLGIGLIVSGVILMSFMIVPYGFNLMFWIGVIGTLGMGLFRLFKFMRVDQSVDKDKRPESKIYKPEDLKPIEKFYSKN